MTSETITMSRGNAGWHGRWLIVLEFVIVAAILVADRHGQVPLSNTPFLLALGWISLRVRGMRWRDVGFVRSDRWTRVIAIGCVVGIAMELLATYGIEPLLARWIGTPPDLSDFRAVVGNLKLLAVLLVLNWTLAAFGEELVYRGYLMNRIASACGGTRVSWTLSLLLVSLVFGCAHGESQGITGIAMETWNGLLLGLLYLASGRQLAFPIIAHGVSNTLAFVLIYFGRYPGL